MRLGEMKMKILTSVMLACALGIFVLLVSLNTACTQEDAVGTEDVAEYQETEVTLDQVPTAVRETMLNEAGENVITEVERVTRGDREIFEAEWIENEQEVEIRVAADGTLLSKCFEFVDDDDDDDDDNYNDDDDEY